MDWIAPAIGTAIIVAIVGGAVRMMWNWSKNWETRLVAHSDMLDYHGTKIAAHENQLARHDERYKNIQSSLTEVKDGIKGVNSRLDNVIGNNRTAGR